MRRSLLVVLLGACAQVGTVPTEEPAALPEEEPGPRQQCQDEFAWSYDPGIASAEGARHPEPIDVPCPSARRLAATKTGMSDKPQQLTKHVRFCVDVAGKTKAVEIVEPSRDGQINDLLVEAVRGWSFTPAELGGQKVEACSTATFVLRFTGAMTLHP